MTKKTKENPKKQQVKEYTFFEDVFAVVIQIPKGRVTSYGAIANYLGTKMSARIGWRAGDALVLASGINFCSMGSAKAAVLPVPVCAPAIKSRPCSTIGIACA